MLPGSAAILTTGNCNAAIVALIAVTSGAQQKYLAIVREQVAPVLVSYHSNMLPIYAIVVGSVHMGAVCDPERGI